MPSALQKHNAQCRNINTKQISGPHFKQEDLMAYYDYDYECVSVITPGIVPKCPDVLLT